MACAARARFTLCYLIDGGFIWDRLYPKEARELTGFPEGGESRSEIFVIFDHGPCHEILGLELGLGLGSQLGLWIWLCDPLRLTRHSMSVGALGIEPGKNRYPPGTWHRWWRFY